MSFPPQSASISTCCSSHLWPLGEIITQRSWMGQGVRGTTTAQHQEEHQRTIARSKEFIRGCAWGRYKDEYLLNGWYALLYGWDLPHVPHGRAAIATASKLLYLQNLHQINITLISFLRSVNHVHLSVSRVNNRHIFWHITATTPRDLLLSDFFSWAKQSRFEKTPNR